MTDLWLIALAGFLASMVDGALGMGFGPTSASILLGSGVSPAATAATVNIAKIASGLAAGVSHWRFKNIDRQLVIRLAVPGAIGAAVGTAILATVDASVLRPVLALLLVGVGLRILVRFSRPIVTGDASGLSARALERVDLRGVEVAGAAGGLTNGLVGTWGPVVTPFLLHRGLHPRFAVGSVNTAEVAVAVVSVGAMVSAVVRPVCHPPSWRRCWSGASQAPRSLRTWCASCPHGSSVSRSPVCSSSPRRGSSVAPDGCPRQGGRSTG